MPNVFIPPLMQPLVGNVPAMQVSGTTVRQIIDELEARFPGIRDRLCTGGVLKPGLAVAVDGKVSSRGLQQPVAQDGEVHFLPGIGGG